MNELGSALKGTSSIRASHKSNASTRVIDETVTVAGQQEPGNANSTRPTYTLAYDAL